MHIMEGYLPVVHALGWGAASTPFVAMGFRSIRKQVRSHPELKMVLGVSAAFTFVLSALKMPSVTGSCSHPTGTGLGAVLFGPVVMAPLGAIVLLFQALLLAHGGLTTLGANIFSMAVAGPFASYAIFKAGQKLSVNQGITVFLAAALGDLLTYLVTSFQLAFAFPAAQGGVAASFLKFAGIFAFTQVPLAISEGLLTVVIFNLLAKHNTPVFRDLGIVSSGREVEA